MTNTEVLDRCPYCGARVGGYTGCQSLMHEVTAQAFGNVAYFTRHRAVVDCYSLQHPEFYCVSAKSYAAHLGGLCCKMEHEGQNEIYTAINRWLDGRVDDLQKPKVLTFRGNLTITHVREATDVTDHIKRVDEWSKRVWDAYAELHDTARGIIQSALAVKK